MTNKELQQLLKLYPDDWEIVCQKDSEGNGYSPLAGIEGGYYSPETTWCGSFYNKEELDEYMEEYDEKPEPLHDAIVFWPIS